VEQNEKLQDYINGLNSLQNITSVFGFIVFNDDETKKLHCEKILDSPIIDLKRPSPSEIIRDLYKMISEKDLLLLDIGLEIDPQVYSQLFSIYNGRFDGWVVGIPDRVFKNLENKKLIFLITKDDLQNPVYVNLKTSVCRIK